MSQVYHFNESASQARNVICGKYPTKDYISASFVFQKRERAPELQWT